MKPNAVISALLILLVAACSSDGGDDSGSSSTAGGGSGSEAAGASGAGAGSIEDGGAAGSSGGTQNNGGEGGSAGTDSSVAGGGSGGSGGSGGASGAANEVDAVRRSAGCSLDADIETGSYQESQLAGRNVWVRLPEDYDPNRAYPLIFWWKGCGGAGALSVLHLEEVAAADAIIVHGDIAPGSDCYDTADGAAFVDLPFFDAFLADLETRYCVDQAHVFSAGFSSGAWLTQFLACQRGDVLRAVGTIAGGFKPSFLLGAPACKGKIAAFMISDLSDTDNPFFDLDNDGDSVEIAVNQWLTFNGCVEMAWNETAGQATGPDTNVCRAYEGCGDYPVELCLTTGKGHADQATLSVPGFWAFFSQFLPPNP